MFLYKVACSFLKFHVPHTTELCVRFHVMKTQKTIRNCSILVKYDCPKHWDNLDHTEVSTIRFCNTCDKKVYFCCSDEETIQHTKLGNCIAMEIPSEGELPLLFVGRVESMYNTDATRLEPGDAP